MLCSEIAPVSADASLLFCDDFSQGQLDRSKWRVRVTGKVVNNEQQAYVDSAETIYLSPAHEAPGAENGALVLHPRYRPGYMTTDGQRFDFISGRIDTRETFQFTYGSASTRLRLPAGPGLWPAFWIMGEGAWPANGEIDVLEYVGEPDWISCAVHGPGYSGEAALVNKLFFHSVEDATAWHVYSVDWMPDSLVFKVDGAAIYRVTRPMVNFFGPWVFDSRKYLILNFALGGTYPFKTNGLQTPYYGLAEETVGMVKDNQARVLVDWVRVCGV